MDGTKFVLDTNAVIAIVAGNNDVVWQLNSANFVAFSIVSVIEFLAFPHLTEKDKHVFEEIVTEASVITLDYDDKVLIQNIINIRKNFKLKLPDAIIGATALRLVGLPNCFQRQRIIKSTRPQLPQL